MKTVVLGATLILSLGASPAISATSSTLATTDSGKVAGVVSDGVLSFKGIPFAQPPVGDLRWRAPQPLKPWSEIRSAAAYGHDCMQKPVESDAAPLGVTPSEDCLVVNVWRPANSANAKLPILVWIYGGGFVNGGSSPAVYDGAQFAKQGVVFVSFNYRLGRFGFFSHPALTAANADGGRLANYGFMDQVAALKWVQRNAASFGGDAGNVTVMGESAGGGSVHMLLTSPEGRGLFQKAIVMSGGGRVTLGGPLIAPKAGDPVFTPEETGSNFAKSVGVEGSGPEALKALRALSTDQVVAGLNMTMRLVPASSKTYSGPIEDGRYVIGDPQKVYQARRENRATVMVGTTSADLGLNMARSKEEVFARFGQGKAAAAAAYDPHGDAALSAIGTEISMDVFMTEPARFAAKTLTSHGARVYAYRFSYVAKALRGSWKTGAPHASDIPYFFDTVKARYGDDLTPEDQDIARRANVYVVNFAKSGDPNGRGLSPWPTYNAKADVVLDFGSDGQAVAKPDPRKARLDAVEAMYGPGS